MKHSNGKRTSKKTEAKPACWAFVRSVASVHSLSGVFIAIGLILVGCGSPSVTPPTGSGSVNAIEIVPGEDLVFSTVHENRNLDVIATRSDGSPYDGTPSWSSSDGTVVDVTPEGIVTALAAGSATVAASVGSVSDSVRVTVSTPVPAAATVAEPGYEGQDFDIGTAFGSTRVDPTTATATVQVSDVEDTLVVATAPDGRVFLSIARATPTTGLSLQQATFGVGVSAPDTAWTLVHDHPLLMVRSEGSNSITDDARENLGCLLDNLKDASCTRVTTAADTQQAFDELVSALRSTGHDFESDTVQDALLQAALRVSRDLDASLGLSTANLASQVLATGATDDYVELDSVDIDRFHYDLGANGDRVLPRLLGGDVRDRTRSGGRGVDYTFRFIQVDASQYTSPDDIASTIRANQPLAVTGESQTRLLPLNSITKRMSIFNWLSSSVASLFTWLPWVDNEPPGSIELQDDHAYVVVGTSPGWGLNTRSEVLLDWDRIPNLPNIQKDVVANRIHNSVALALDVVLIHGSFTNRFSDNLRARVAEDAVACMITATTGYVAGDWSTDTNKAGSFFTDLAGCTSTALITNEISDFSDASTAQIEGWKRHVGTLITQAGRMVTTAMQEASSSGSLQPQIEPISTTVALAALVAKYELALKVAGVGHRIADMFLTLTPIELAVIQQGSPNYSRAGPVEVAFSAIAAGGTHSVALDLNDNAWSWGYDSDGQLGNGGANASMGTPVQVDMPSGTTFTTITAGLAHSLALDRDGNAWSWGDDYYGQLGDAGTNTNVDTPVQVDMPAGVTFTTIKAGAFHSLALDTDGNAWSWGRDDFGQLGNGGTDASVGTPVQVAMPTGTTFTTIDAGRLHSLALDRDGNAWAWGDDGDGRLGNGGTDASVGTPVQVAMPTGTTFTTITAGFTHSLALDLDGNAWAWGDDGDGRLGNGGTNTSLDTPFQVAMPTGSIFTTVQAGGGHSLAVDRNGNAWSWGIDNYGQLGDGGTNTNMGAPAEVIMP